MRFIDFLAYFRRPNSFITSHGLMVATNGYSVKKEYIEKITENTISKWEAATNWIGVRHSVEFLPIVVYFREKPFEVQCHTCNLNGLFVNRGLIIGYDYNLQRTALAHEIGHCIHAHWTGEISEKKSHEFMKEYGLY